MFNGMLGAVVPNSRIEFDDDWEEKSDIAATGSRLLRYHLAQLAAPPRPYLSLDSDCANQHIGDYLLDIAGTRNEICDDPRRSLRRMHIRLCMSMSRVFTRTCTAAVLDASVCLRAVLRRPYSFLLCLVSLHTWGWNGGSAPHDSSQQCQVVTAALAVQAGGGQPGSRLRPSFALTASAILIADQLTNV